MTNTPYKVVPMDRMRRVIARRMREAVAEQPHVTLHARADASAILAARTHSAGRSASVTVTVLILHAVARALRESPRVNGRVEDDEVRLYQAVNLGCAVALDDGIVVPVIRDADQKTPDGLAVELADFRHRAGTKSLRGEDLADGTFTVTNLGAHGVEFFTPILNPPQLGILGVGAIRDELQCEDGEMRNVSKLHLSLTFDHASVDGAPAALLLQAIRRHIENFDTAVEDDASDESVALRAG